MTRNTEEFGYCRSATGIYVGPPPFRTCHRFSLFHHLLPNLSQITARFKWSYQIKLFCSHITRAQKIAGQYKEPGLVSSCACCRVCTIMTRSQTANKCLERRQSCMRAGLTTQMRASFMRLLAVECPDIALQENNTGIHSLLGDCYYPSVIPTENESAYRTHNKTQ